MYFPLKDKRKISIFTMYFTKIFENINFLCKIIFDLQSRNFFPRNGTSKYHHKV